MVLSLGWSPGIGISTFAGDAIQGKTQGELNLRGVTVGDKDRQIAELSKRVEQLERGQRFWTTTLSNALGGVMSAVVIGVAALLWRNPDLFGWFTVPKLVTVFLTLAAAVPFGGFLVSTVMVYRLGWKDWDRRMRVSFTMLVVGEILLAIFVVAATILY